MFDENADFGRHPAARRPHCKDCHRSLKGGQKTDDGTFSEFRGKKPCWCLSNTQVFKDTHPHLFNITGPKDSCGNNTLRAVPGTKAPWLQLNLAQQKRLTESG